MKRRMDGWTDGRERADEIRPGAGSAALTLYAFLHRTVRPGVSRIREPRLIRGPRSPVRAQGGPVAGSTSTEARRERRRRGKRREKNGGGGGGGEGRARGGKRGGRRAPRASRTINHRGNSIDGSSPLEGTSDACRTLTFAASVERPAKRRSVAARVRVSMETPICARCEK